MWSLRPWRNEDNFSKEFETWGRNDEIREKVLKCSQVDIKCSYNPLKRRLMAISINKFFQNLEKVFRFICYAFDAVIMGMWYFFDSRPLLLWRRDHPQSPDINTNKSTLWLKMYRVLPGPSFVWNQCSLNWVWFRLDFTLAKTHLDQVLSVPNLIYECTEFYLDPIYSKSTIS